jgi:hypothetical protein
MELPQCTPSSKPSQMLGGEPGEREADAETMSVWHGELLGDSEGDTMSVWQGELLGDSEGDILWQGVSEAVGVLLALLEGETARERELLGLAGRVREEDGLGAREWLELGDTGRLLELLGVLDGDALLLFELDAVGVLLAVCKKAQVHAHRGENSKEGEHHGARERVCEGW